MADREDIQISTVMLCWNRLALSKQCLESYLATISVPNELFVVNNASTDGTRRWLDTFEDDRRVTARIHTDQNDPAAALNQALERCSGQYLHVMENDYIYRDGWDRYVTSRFAQIRELGQLCVTPGQRRMRGDHYKRLFVLSRHNVVTSSVYRREVFFDHGIRYRNHLRGRLPSDVDFSMAIRRLGLLVAWPDRGITVNVGHSEAEWRRDPGYYIRDYKLRLLSPDRWIDQLRNIGQFDVRDWWDDMRRLVKLYGFKVRGVSD